MWSFPFAVLGFYLLSVNATPLPPMWITKGTVSDAKDQCKRRGLTAFLSKAVSGEGATSVVTISENTGSFAACVRRHSGSNVQPYVTECARRSATVCAQVPLAGASGVFFMECKFTTSTKNQEVEDTETCASCPIVPPGNGYFQTDSDGRMERSFYFVHAENPTVTVGNRISATNGLLQYGSASLFSSSHFAMPNADAVDVVTKEPLASFLMTKDGIVQRKDELQFPNVGMLLKNPTKKVVPHDYFYEVLFPTTPGTAQSSAIVYVYHALKHSDLRPLIVGFPVMVDTTRSRRAKDLITDEWERTKDLAVARDNITKVAVKIESGAVIFKCEVSKSKASIPTVRLTDSKGKVLPPVIENKKITDAKLATSTTLTNDKPYHIILLPEPTKSYACTLTKGQAPKCKKV